MVDLPEGFGDWSERAQRVYIAESLTQKEALSLATDQLELSPEIGTEGPLTNRELASFVTALLTGEGCP